MEFVRLYGWFFFIYAFLGWCGEVAFAAVKEKRFVNRGFLNGPLCPIYGVGVAAIVWIGSFAGDSWLMLYVVSAVVTSGIELVTGFILEKLFHTRWWDYSGMPLNIGGYICLPFSLLWGFACVFIIRIFHPLVQSFVNWIPGWLSWTFLVLMTVALAVDLYVTVAQISKSLHRLQQLESLAAELHELSDAMGQVISKKTMEASELGGGITEELSERMKKLQEEMARRKEEMDGLLKGRMPGLRRQLKAFPKLTSKRFKESLDKFRENL